MDSYRTILDKLAAGARERVRVAEQKKPLGEISEEAEAVRHRELEAEKRRRRKESSAAPGARDETFHGARTGFPFEEALSGPGMAFICECKKASPSKGLIAPSFPYLEIAEDYERAGAAAISVLTEPGWFLGSEKYLQEIAASVRIPCLRKDFTVDPYMIYEAKTLGAAAVLLICALLDEETLRRYIALCDSLGLSALVEAHDQAEIGSALRAGARVIGVNNRNLKDFTVDFSNSLRLRKLVPEDVLFVAESGVKTHEDILKLEEAGVDAVLIGETLMRAADRGEALRKLRDG